MGVELSIDVGKMAMHGAFADPEAARDFLINEVLFEAVQYLAFDGSTASLEWLAERSGTRWNVSLPVWLRLCQAVSLAFLA